MIGLKYLDYLSNVDEESLLLGEADSWDLVLLLNVCELPPAHHLQGLDVTEVLVEGELSVHFELDSLVPQPGESVVGVAVPPLETLRLLVVSNTTPMITFIEFSKLQCLNIKVLVILVSIMESPGARCLVPHSGQFSLQVKAPAPRVEAVEDLVGDDEAQLALLDVAREAELAGEVGGHEAKRQDDAVQLADSEGVHVQRRGGESPGEHRLVHPGPGRHYIDIL